MLVVLGCWAAALSQIVDPLLRRKGLVWFAAAHLNVLWLIGAIRTELWGPVPPLTDQILTVAVWGVGGILGGRILVLALANAKEPSSPWERQMRQAGAQEERNRLARDLHDSIKQQIFVIQTAAATVQTRIDSDRSGADAALDQIRNSARDAMTEMEVMMDNLRSVPLENTSLIEALKKQCEALGHRTGAQVDFQLGEMPANEMLPPGSHQAFFRVAQEALANIGRHARAAHVTVWLGSVEGNLELRIQDDGAGFDQTRSSAGMGIENMRARATEFRGRLYLSGSPGEGTTVTFCLPHTRVKPPLTKGTKILFFGWVILTSVGMMALLVLKEHRKGNDLVAYYLAASLVFSLLRAVYKRRLKKAKA